jgi:hypothetical protein
MHDGWPNIYGVYAVAFPRALESDELPWRQISSIGNVATMDEELSAGYVINDESVASRAIIKFHLASHATPTLIGREPSGLRPAASHPAAGSNTKLPILDELQILCSAQKFSNTSWKVVGSSSMYSLPACL